MFLKSFTPVWGLIVCILYCRKKCHALFYSKIERPVKKKYFYLKLELIKRFNVVIYIIYFIYALNCRAIHRFTGLSESYLDFLFIIFLYMPYKHYRINKLIRQYSNSGVL